MTTDARTPANDVDDHGIFVGDESEMVKREDAALERGDHTTALTSTMLRVSTKALEVLTGAGVVTRAEIDAWANDDDNEGWGVFVPQLLDRVAEAKAASAPMAVALDAAVRVIATCEDVRQTLRDLIDLMVQIEAGDSNVTIDADVFAEIAFWGAALGSASERLNAALSGVYNAPAELQFTRERLSHGGHVTTAKRRQDRAAHKAHIIELASDRLSLPLPAGRPRWTASVVADEVTSSWKLDGRVPLNSTIRTIVKEAIAEGAIRLPG